MPMINWRPQAIEATASNPNWGEELITNIHFQHVELLYALNSHYIAGVHECRRQESSSLAYLIHQEASASPGHESAGSRERRPETCYQTLGDRLQQFETLQ